MKEESIQEEKGPTISVTEQQLVKRKATFGHFKSINQTCQLIILSCLLCISSTPNATLLILGEGGRVAQPQ